jgi:hypothetical protein
MTPRGLASCSETDNALPTRRKPRSRDKAMAPAPWPQALYDVPEQHVPGLHAQGLSDDTITKEPQR